jgi:hypothetical protein
MRGLPSVKTMHHMSQMNMEISQLSPTFKLGFFIFAAGEFGGCFWLSSFIRSGLCGSREGGRRDEWFQLEGDGGDDNG